MISHQNARFFLQSIKLHSVVPISAYSLLRVALSISSEAKIASRLCCLHLRMTYIPNLPRQCTTIEVLGSGGVERCQVRCMALDDCPGTGSCESVTATRIEIDRLSGASKYPIGGYGSSETPDWGSIDGAGEDIRRSVKVAADRSTHHNSDPHIGSLGLAIIVPTIVKLVTRVFSIASRRSRIS